MAQKKTAPASPAPVASPAVEDEDTPQAGDAPTLAEEPPQAEDAGEVAREEPSPAVPPVLAQDERPEPERPESEPLPSAEDMRAGIEQLAEERELPVGAPILAAVAGLRGMPAAIASAAEALAWALNTGAAGPHATREASLSASTLAATLHAATLAHVTLDTVAAFLRERFPASVRVAQ